MGDGGCGRRVTVCDGGGCGSPCCIAHGNVDAQRGKGERLATGIVRHVGRGVGSWVLLGLGIESVSDLNVDAADRSASES